MDYEKLHKETLESLQVMVHKGKITEDVAKGICSDFKLESEDERIMKRIKNALVEWNEKYSFPGDSDDMIAWIERQAEQKLNMIQWTGDNLKDVIEFTGYSPKFNEWFKTWEEYETYVHSHNNIFKMFYEDGSHYEVPVGAWIVKTPDGYNVASKSTYIQKPAPKVEPKFKEEDWVVNNNGEPQISQVIERSWPNSKLKGVKDNLKFFINTATLDKQYHLWAIEDAKPGDILAMEPIEKEYTTPFVAIYKNRGLNFFNSYCFIAFNGEFFEGSIGHSDNIHPATKEQRDLLFKEMKEAGYEWDSDKKVLKKIEQKSAEWSEEDKKTIHLACEFIRHRSEPNGNIGGVNYSELIERLKSLKPQPHKWYIKKGHWYMCIVDKPEFGWTKGKVYQSPEDGRIETDYKGDLTNWPDIEPWFRPATHNEIPDVQFKWKPSEEQMNSLKWFCDIYKDIPGGNKLLCSLYNDLKKL